MRKFLSRGGVAAAVAALVLSLWAGTAHATDATVTAKVVCVDASQSLWRVTITFTNQWDGATVVRLIEADGGSNFDESHTLSGNGASWTPTAFTTSAARISVEPSSNHPDHFHNSLPTQINRPEGCVKTVVVPPGTAALAPPTVATPPTTPAPAPPTTAVTAPTTGATAPPTSPASTRPAAPAPPPSPTTTTVLPTTGGIPVGVLVLGLVLVPVGVVAVTTTRRRAT